MTAKIIGAVFIFIACGGIGLHAAAQYLKEQKLLRQLVVILDYLECELQYRLTPLPDLCKLASSVSNDVLSYIFKSLADALEAQSSPDAQSCMISVMKKTAGLTPWTRRALFLLGQSLGRFDVSGQIKEFKGIRHVCLRRLQEMADHKGERTRQYQTLGFCTGAALVVLLS